MARQEKGVDLTNSPLLGLYLPSFTEASAPDWTPLFQVARAADVAGIDRIVISDHVVFGERLEEYAKPEIGGQAGGKQPTGPDGAWLEPLTTLAVLAGMTKRVRLGTQILIAALRRPVVLAKTAATLDVLSGGRLDLGVGVGWQREEYDAAGLAFEGRGKLLNHTLEVCQLLWREQSASYSSPLLTFENIHQMPKPAQAGGVPVWVSGTIIDSAMSRLARFGAGWIPWGPDAADMHASIPRMRAAVAKFGRDPAELRVVANLRVFQAESGAIEIERTLEPVLGLIAAGATDFRAAMRFPAEEAGTTAELHRLASAFRAAVGRPAP